VRGGASACALDAATLPFVRVTRAMLPASAPRVIVIDDVERACPNHQAGGTRLVLTQSTYLLQKIVDLLETKDRVIVTADRAALERNAGEAFEGRGPWAAFELVDIDRETTLVTTEDTEDTELKSVQEKVHSSVSSVSSVVASLVRAYTTASTTERVRICIEATGDDPVAYLALASACREAGDMRTARTALDRAAVLSPDWEAVHFESGKWWLAADDMEQARAAFQRAADLMPSFSAAFSNLGATLGELEQPEAALAAFRQALAHDRRSVSAWNNVGVVSRELGRLDESEAACRRVIELAPAFVFGYYNLGHTLFLAGRFDAALEAYKEGRRRDPEQNRRQGCRLAMARLATGDAEGAERDLWQCANAAPGAEREDLLLEAYEIAQALLAQDPALDVHRPFVERIGAAILRDGKPRG